MDIGLADIIDRSEKYFGKFLTKLVLFSVLIAITSFSGSVIWAYTVKPLMRNLPDVSQLRGLADAAFSGVVVGLGIGIGLLILQVVRFQLGIRRIDRMTTEVDDQLSRLEKLSDRADGAADRAQESLSAAEMLIDGMIVIALEKGLLSQQSVDEVRQMLKEMGEQPVTVDATAIIPSEQGEANNLR